MVAAWRVEIGGTAHTHARAHTHTHLNDSFIYIAIAIAIAIAMVQAAYFNRMACWVILYCACSIAWFVVGGLLGIESFGYLYFSGLLSG